MAKSGACAPAHHPLPPEKGLLFPKPPGVPGPSRAIPGSLRGLSPGPHPPGLCHVEETWCHSQLMAAGDPPAGASSCPPALVSPARSSPPAAPTRGVTATPAGVGGSTRELRKPVSKGGGQDPVMAPGCLALVPAEGYLTHATASQGISRPFSLLCALPGAEVQRERPTLGALFSAGTILGPTVATGGFP